MTNGSTVTMDISKDDWNALVSDVAKGKLSIDDLCIIVKGKPEHKIEGLVQKVDNHKKDLKTLTELVEDVVEQRKQQRAIMIGVGIGIGLNVVTGGATLFTLVNALQTIAAAGVVP